MMIKHYLCKDNPTHSVHVTMERKPAHPHFNRRALHHDYTRPARYMITIIKSPAIENFSSITGDPKDGRSISVAVSRSGAAVLDAIVGRQLTPLFSKGFNDRIVYTAEQWENQLRYVTDNPRRYLIKKTFPEYLLQRWILTMPDGKIYTLSGNIFLLRQPMLFCVKTSRHFTPEEAARKSEEWKEALSNGGVPISPYIHPHEKELKKIAIDEGYSIIRVCANGFSDRSAATGNEFELISEGRLLLIGQPEFNTRKQELTYSSAQDLNRLARHIAEACNSGTPFTLRKL